MWWLDPFIGVKVEPKRSDAENGRHVVERCWDMNYAQACILLPFAGRRRSAMTGAGAPRAGFGFGFRRGHSVFHSIARDVTDPGIGCTDWLVLDVAFAAGFAWILFRAGPDLRRRKTPRAIAAPTEVLS